MKKKHNKSIAIATSIAMVLSTATPTFADDINSVKFPDISGHWAEGDMIHMSQAGIMGGYPDGTMKPQQPVTIAESIKLINQSLKLKGSGNLDLIKYTDVKKDAWYAYEVSVALENGYLKNITSGDKLNPNAKATREQLSSMLSQAMKLQVNNQAILDQFKDKEKINSTLKIDMEAAVEKGLFGGYEDNTLRPKEPVIRATIAAVARRTMNEIPAETVTVKNKDIKLGQNDILVSKYGETIKEKEVDTIWISPVEGSGIITLENITAKKVIVLGEKTNVVIKGSEIIQEKSTRKSRLGNGESKIGLLEVKSSNSTITVKKNVTIDKVDVKKESKNTIIEGEGLVKKADISGSDFKLKTVGTEFKVQPGATNVKVADKVVPSNTEGKTNTTGFDKTTPKVPEKPVTPEKPATGGGSSSGGSSSGGGSSSTKTNVTAITGITGTFTEGEILTAGDVTPSSATVTYQWQKASEKDGTYTNIIGATAKKYTLTSDDVDKYIKVSVIGTGNYTATVTSAATEKVAAKVPVKTNVTAIAAITGTFTDGEILTAGDVTPSSATVTYQWQKASEKDGTYTNITGATAKTYTLTSDDVDKYIKVSVIGTGNYTATATSAATEKVATKIKNVEVISAEIIGTPETHAILTAVANEGATNVNYKWQMADTSNGNYIDIAGATKSTLKLTAEQDEKYVRVIISGDNSSSATSNSVGPVVKVNTITNLNIEGITAPVVGESPFSTPIETAEYTATVEWSADPLDEMPAKFVANNAYTATITVQPKGEYTLKGIEENSFTVEGAVCENNANSGVIKAQFHMFSTSNIDAPSMITNYRGPGGVITIPDTINGTDIKSLYYKMFASEPEKITGIILEDGIETIDGALFIAACSNLKSITLSTSFKVPTYNLFSSESLEKIIVPEENQNLKVVDDVLFSKDGKTLICYPGAKNDTSYTVPDGVTTILERAFENNKYIESVVIPEGVTTIGNFTFNNCTSLKEINNPASVTTIGGYSYMPSLTAINIAEGNQNYSSIDGALLSADGTKLYQIPLNGVGEIYTVPDSVTEFSLKGFFEENSTLKKVIIPSSVTKITDTSKVVKGLTDFEVSQDNPNYSSEDGVLFNKDKTELIKFPAAKIMDTYTVPNGVTTIKACAFSGVNNLDHLIIPESVTKLESGFVLNSKIQNVTIGKGVTFIDTGLANSAGKYIVDLENTAFSSDEYGVLYNKDKTSLYIYPSESTSESYVMPNSVTAIKFRAFNYGSNLKNVTLSSNLKDMSAGIFQCNLGIEEIVIPESVTSYGGGQFSGCTNLKKVTILNRTTNLNGDFEGCTSLEEVILPETITNLGNKVFEGCVNLKKIYFKGNAPEITNSYSIKSAFVGVPATVYYLAGKTGFDSGIWLQHNPTTFELSDLPEIPKVQSLMMLAALPEPILPIVPEVPVIVPEEKKEETEVVVPEEKKEETEVVVPEEKKEETEVVVPEEKKEESPVGVE